MFWSKIWVWVEMDMIGTELFDQNVDMECAELTMRCVCTQLVLSYLIKMFQWHVLKWDLHFNNKLAVQVFLPKDN